MPIDYKLYPKNWKTEIRPAILQRAANLCENCFVPNKMLILRGTYNGIEVYQEPDYGRIFNADTSEYVDSNYVGEVALDDPNRTFIQVVLTIAHMDHNIENNDYGNLKALCQRCHNRHDKDQRKASRKANKKQIELF